MGIQERKEREKTEMREKILQAAADIVKSEGIDKLSIRKLADKIEYSPAIIYHYFSDKEEVLDNVIEERYKMFVNLLLDNNSRESSPEEQLRSGLKSFISLALKLGKEYKTIMLHESPHILKQTAVLSPGAAGNRQAIGMLCQTLGAIFKNNKTMERDLELTAQIIWASMFGLIIRMITENVEEEQQKRLTEEFLNFVMNGLNCNERT